MQGRRPTARSVRLTALALSGAAEAHAAAQVLFSQGGSAAGPKPGRDGFSALLAGYLRDAGSFIAVGLLAP